MEIKIIDESLNDQKIYGIMIRYCSLYIFGKNIEEMDVINGIGDTIFLHQFNFTVWN
jgi:hypothetical protein